MQPPSRPPRRVIAAALIAVLTASGCSTKAAGSAPTWVPQPNFQQNNEPQPQLPGNGFAEPTPSPPRIPVPGSAPNAPGSPGGPGASPTQPATDPAVVATKLNQPTGVVVLQDGTALVGERTTGRILRVQPRPGLPVRLVQTLPGVDGRGDGGLLDLAISPSFNQDGLIYAYVTTATDNRVVHFALTTAPSPVITGIPKGKTGNVGRIAFDATDALLTGTGDAGRPALAADRSSLAGKILRTDDLGRPLPDNPTAGSRVYATGFRSVDGLCVDPAGGNRFATSTGLPDEVNVIKAGSDYGWPNARPNSTGPAKTLPADASGAGGCAVLAGRFVVATSTGMSLVLAGVSQSAVFGSFTSTIQRRYGRLRSVAGAADGALWVTTSNRDGRGTPVPDDDRVLRIVSSETGGNPVV